MSQFSAPASMNPKRQTPPSTTVHGAKRPKLDRDTPWTQQRMENSPWEFETDRHVSEPPDIDLKQLIEWDEKDIAKLLENETIEPKERCLQYDSHEVFVESNLLVRYCNWAISMKNLAQDAEDGMRQEFFEGLVEEVRGDLRDVQEEYKALQREQGRRRQRREALGLPGGRPYILKGTRCYWDYQEKGFYFWEDEVWKREQDGRRREWDKELGDWTHFRKVNGKWVKEDEDVEAVDGKTKESGSEGYATATEGELD